MFAFDYDIFILSDHVTTIVGRAGVEGHDDGDVTHATFDLPCSILCDAANNIYIADRWNHCIRNMNLDSGKFVSIALHVACDNLYC